MVDYGARRWRQCVRAQMDGRTSKAMAVHWLGPSEAATQARRAARSAENVMPHRREAAST